MNDIKIEIQNLIRDRVSAKKEVVLLERTVDLKELERLKLDEKLQRSRRKCEELEETVTRLLEEKKVSNDREKRANERYGKIAAAHTEMLNQRNKSILDLNEKINELKNKNLENIEANKTIEELRLKISESDKAAELYKSRIENLSARIRKIEESLKVGDIADLVNDVRKLATSDEGGNLEFQDSRGKVDSAGNADAVVVSPGVRSASNSTGSRSGNRSSKKDDINSVRSRTREGDALGTVKTSSCSQSGRTPPQVESDEHKEPLGSGVRVSGTLMSGAGRFAKIACPSSASGGVIEVIDTDDEAYPDGVAHISNRGVGSNVGEKNEINSVRSPSSGMRSKRSGTNLTANSTTKRKRNDEDEFVASPPSEKIGSKKFTYEADMLRAFQQDEQLCMNAVCALYRQQAKPKGHADLSEMGGFSPLDSVSGCALAEYLIDGDEELRLRKSVSEVKKRRPDVISQCRKLANKNVEKLFAVYCAGDDPLFCQL